MGDFITQVERRIGFIVTSSTQLGWAHIAPSPPLLPSNVRDNDEVLQVGGEYHLGQNAFAKVPAYRFGLLWRGRFYGPLLPLFTVYDTSK